MPQRLTNDILKDLPAPDKGNKVHYDTEIKGLGLRITAAGAKVFVFNYRYEGRERRGTIGPYGKDQWTLVRARKKAGECRRDVNNGIDPFKQRDDARTAPTVADMCERFAEVHYQKRRPNTQRDYRAIIAGHILPAMKRLKVAEVTYTHVDDLHRKITKAGTPYRANRTISTLSKMFSLAIKWGWRPDNPCVGIERNVEPPRKRYASSDELVRLSKALAEHEDQQAANIVRMCLLTGARSGEVKESQWDQFDLEEGIWTKPGAETKQKTEHRVPLSAPARQLLSELREAALEDDVYVFPGRLSGHRVEIKAQWAAICKAANIEGLRLHDLRHTYASVLVSAGLSLPVIGALLGHTQAQTTQRYAHLMDDPLRKATERAGAIITGKPSAEIVNLKTGA